MTPPDGADDLFSARRDKDGSLRLQVRALADAARGRLEGSSAQSFLRRPGALAFAGSVMLFGAALLICVLPFVILLSSLADHRIDTDLSRHIGLNRRGAVIVSQLFRSSAAHSAVAIVTALILAAAGTMAVASSLQVTYERIFGQQHRGWKDVLASPPGPVSCSDSWSPAASSASLRTPWPALPARD
jgi:hypothetical protein